MYITFEPHAAEKASSDVLPLSFFYPRHEPSTKVQQALFIMSGAHSKRTRVAVLARPLPLSHIAPRRLKSTDLGVVPDSRLMSTEDGLHEMRNQCLWSWVFRC